MRTLRPIAAALFLFSPFVAHSDLIISDVNFTANSVTFTADGVLTQSSEGNPTQFSIQYLGDLFIGWSYSANVWSTLVFDTGFFSLAGNTGDFGMSDWGYTWSGYLYSLLGATATNRTVTVTFGQDYLNTATTDGIIRFVYGNGCSCEFYSVIASFDATSLNSTAVPEPGTLTLLGLGLLGMAARRKKTV